MYEQIIQALLKEATPRILKGISPQEASIVSAEFERLLIMSLEKKGLVPSPQNDELTWKAGRYLIEETLRVPPENRLEYIQKELLIEEISDLDTDAQRMAENSLKKSADLLALRAQARVIRERVSELQRVLHAKGPDWEQGFVRTLSETSMDCLFVLGETPYSSMRLGRDIRFMQETGNWPPAWYAELWPEDTKDK